jgi:hypothetical protein
LDPQCAGLVAGCCGVVIGGAGDCASCMVLGFGRYD